MSNHLDLPVERNDESSLSTYRHSEEKQTVHHVVDYGQNDHVHPNPQYNDSSDGDRSPSITLEPNHWSKFRYLIREPAAELIGTCFLVMFGLGANCQSILTANINVFPTPKGDPASNVLGWAAGIAMGGWACGGISGGHMNPAITLALAVFRGFPWRKVPIYWIAQLLGSTIGAGFVYAQWFHAISIVEGGGNIRTLKTASLFGTYAAPFLTDVSAFFCEFFLTAVLVFMVFAMTDKNNMAPQAGTAPLLLFVVFTGIVASFGSLTGFAMNPARDLGPRFLTAMVGYGRSVFTFRNQYWIWCPIMAPFLGGLAGGALYDSMLFIGEESITNRPDVIKGHMPLRKHRTPPSPDRVTNKSNEKVAPRPP